MIFCYFNADVQNEYIRYMERFVMKIKLGETIRKNSKISKSIIEKQNSR